MYFVFNSCVLLVMCYIYNVILRSGGKFEIKFFLIDGIIKFVKVEIWFFVNVR